jgi:Uncharacterized conserved protein
VSAKNSVNAVAVRRFSADPERVYEAWLKPEMLERWMFGPQVREEEIVHLAVDPRVGGSFSFMVERKGETIEHLGKYLEMERPTRLAFSWIIAGSPVGSRVKVEIDVEPPGCELTVTHELHPSWAEHVGEMEASWRRLLDGLARAIE